jgi:beta-carotene 15,15'-dioxygenase
MITSGLARFARHAQQTPTYLTIVAGCMLVIYQHWIGPLPLLAQLLFCGVLLLVAGIPHGALDHLVEKERVSRLGEPFSLEQFLTKYLLTMALYAGAWLLAPVPCLFVFLLISAWHFGETDLVNAPATPYWSLARLSAGGFVLAFILLTHAAETTPILTRIVQADKLAMAVWNNLVVQSGGVLRGWATLIIVVMMLAYGQRPSVLDGWRLARLLVVISLTYWLPLLPAFMLYFGGWHALSSFRSLQAYLPHHTPNMALTALTVWRQSLPLTGVAFGGLAIFGGIWHFYMPLLDPIPILFIFLSLITLPHIGVMYAINAESKS